MRAFIDTWKRKLTNCNSHVVISILTKLSQLPKFHLPNISYCSVPYYLKTDSSSTLIYDSFAAILPDEKIYVVWDCIFTEPEKEMFNKIISNINYLGRSESLIEMRVEDKTKPVNCFPVNEITNTNIIRVAVPELYNGRKSQGQWIQDLGTSTEIVLKKHLNNPPALKFVYYQLPENIVHVQYKSKQLSNMGRKYGVIYELNSSVLPLITESIIIAERFHKKLLGIYMRKYKKTSPTLSGIEADGSIMKGHKHIFISTLDINGDGRIDHIMVKSSTALTLEERYTLNIMKSMYQDNGKPDIQMFPVEWLNDMASTLLPKSKTYVSQTPFILNRHYRKGRGDYLVWLKNQVIEELFYIGLPAPIDIQPVKETTGQHRFLWLDFYRSRKNEVPGRGYGFRLIFDSEISIPFNIGRFSHFGMGSFIPDD